MDQITNPATLERERLDEPVAQPRQWKWKATALGVAAALGLYLAWLGFAPHRGNQAAAALTPPQVVTVSQPLQRELDVRAGFLGQFSAIDRVELRAQVGGTLTEIHFKDGQIVHKGDLLFVIDPAPLRDQAGTGEGAAPDRSRPCGARQQPAIARAIAQAQRLCHPGDGRPAHQRAGCRAGRGRGRQGADPGCRARSRILPVRAPFTGRIGARQVSIGSLVAGSRAATSPTTLLTTLVSLDPLYLDFDMSESDFLTFSRERARIKGPLADKVADRPQRREQPSPAKARSTSSTTRSIAPAARSTPAPRCRTRICSWRPASSPGSASPSHRRRRSSVAGRRRRARPVAASGDDRWSRRHRGAEDRRHRRSARRPARDPVRPRGRATASSSTAWCAPFPAPRSRRRTARSITTQPPTAKAENRRLNRSFP